jgi:hypothetical protein
MSTERQQFLKFFQAENLESEWLVMLLKDRDWLTAGQILQEIGSTDTDAARRRLRATAEASAGRIAGGQRGYKLTEEMTREEFGHFRNWMLGQATAMQRRITLSDKVWYSRNPVPGTA